MLQSECQPHTRTHARRTQAKGQREQISIGQCCRRALHKQRAACLERITSEVKASLPRTPGDDLQATDSRIKIVDRAYASDSRASYAWWPLASSRSIATMHQTVEHRAFGDRWHRTGCSDRRRLSAGRGKRPSVLSYGDTSSVSDEKTENAYREQRGSHPLNSTALPRSCRLQVSNRLMPKPA